MLKNASYFSSQNRSAAVDFRKKKCLFLVLFAAKFHANNVSVLDSAADILCPLHYLYVISFKPRGKYESKKVHLLHMANKMGTMP